MSNKEDQQKPIQDKVLKEKLSGLLSSPKKKPGTARPRKENQPPAGGRGEARKVQEKPAGTKPAEKEQAPAKSSRNGQRRPQQPRKKPEPKLISGKEKPGTIQIIPLGGLGEVGKNLNVIRYNHQMIIVDAGMTMPEDDMLGIDIVIPDIQFVRDNIHQLLGVVITHGHEDHIGALPYILDELNVPVYGTRFTVGLIRRKLKERKFLTKPRLNVVNPREDIKLGPFRITFIKVSHSIPDAVALAIETPVGTIVHTGDFKIDFTPIDGQLTDLYTLANLGEKGVLALMADSTNAEKPGFTRSEKIVGKNVEAIFQETKGRIIIASFASNVHRLQQIFDAAHKTGRKVAVVGRSMESITEVAQELSYLKIAKGQLMDIRAIQRLPKDKICIITTGSQGEANAALSRMATQDHRSVEILPDDTVMLSAMAIPGNEKYIAKLIDHILGLGAKVVYGRSFDIHVSGHAQEDDLKLMISLLKPKFFIPVHGEKRMHIAHKAIAMDMAIPQSNIVIAENGDLIEVSKEKIHIAGKVHSGVVFIDGLGVGDVSNVVLRDRKILSENGMIVAILTMNKKGQIVGNPELVTRGFVYVKQSEALMEDIEKQSRKIVEKIRQAGTKEWSQIKSAFRDDLDNFIYQKTQRKPMLVVKIVEV